MNKNRLQREWFVLKCIYLLLEALTLLCKNKKEVDGEVPNKNKSDRHHFGDVKVQSFLLIKDINYQGINQ
jgi:hypothetical protein